jgi:hypothetical protein
VGGPGRAFRPLNDSPRRRRHSRSFQTANIGTSSYTTIKLGHRSPTHAPTDRLRVRTALPVAGSSGRIISETIFESPTAPKRSTPQTISSRTASLRTMSSNLCALIETVDLSPCRRASSVNVKVIVALPPLGPQQIKKDMFDK